VCRQNQDHLTKKKNTTSMIKQRLNLLTWSNDLLNEKYFGTERNRKVEPKVWQKKESMPLRFPHNINIGERGIWDCWKGFT